MTDPTRLTVEPLQRQDERVLQQKGRKAIERNFNTLQSLSIEYINPESLFPNAYNPNRQSEEEFELLLASMSEDGFTQPVLVQRTTREIIDGEHRWRAAVRLGLKEIPVVFTDMTEAQQRIATLRHNRARGSEDIELTIQLLKDLQSIGAIEHAIDSLGIDDKELNLLLGDLPAPDANASENFRQAWVPAPPNIQSVRKLEENVFEVASPTLEAAKARLEIKLNNLPNDAEEERQVLLKTETTWHSIPVTFDANTAPLILEVLGQDAPAKSLLQLCRYHLKVSGVPVEDWK